MISNYCSATPIVFETYRHGVFTSNLLTALRDLLKEDSVDWMTATILQQRIEELNNAAPQKSQLYRLLPEGGDFIFWSKKKLDEWQYESSVEVNACDGSPK